MQDKRSSRKKGAITTTQEESKYSLPRLYLPELDISDMKLSTFPGD
jgi:hypothetical protein